MNIALPTAFPPDGEPSKFLACIKRRASKNFRWTRVQSLADTTFLAYWLYTSGEYDQSLDVCQFLMHLEFSGNGYHWAWIEGSLVLQSRQLRQRGLSGEASKCMERVRSVGNFEYRLTGEVLGNYRRNVADAISGASGPPESQERDWRIMVFHELCILIELGGSESLPVASLETQFLENMKRMQELAGLSGSPDT